MNAHADVVVVGAGPAGSAAAWHLAKRGRSVLLLERTSFPREKACGDALTRESVALLEEMGLGPRLAEFQSADGLRVIADHGRERESKNGRGEPALGRVVPRHVLDELLARNAAAAGAALREKAIVMGLRRRNGRVSGVVVRNDHGGEPIDAEFVIAAGGASSTFMNGSSPTHGDHAGLGFALRGYYEDIEIRDQKLAIYVPLVDPATERTLPGYGWVFPVDGSRANIGVGYFPSERDDLDLNLRRLFDGFIRDLRTREPRFARMRLRGKLRGGPLPCGLDVARCASPGLLVVGDAAGLVDPFTGEGINSALASGKLAASAIDRALAAADPQHALADYRDALGQRYRARFPAGRRLVEHHAFLWKVFEQTFDVESGLFDDLRRAVIDYGFEPPDQPGAAPELLRDAADQSWLAERAREADDRLRNLLDAEFSLLSKVCARSLEAQDHRLRTLLVLLSSLLGAGRQEAVRAAIALEAAVLACGLHVAILDETPATSGDAGFRAPSARWGNVFALTASDGLLAKAYQLAAGLGAAICGRVGRASAAVYAAHVDEARRRQPSRGADDYLAFVSKSAAPFCQLACYLGAAVARAPAEYLVPLEAYGHNIGMASHVAGEVLELQAGDGALRQQIAIRTGARRYSLPMLLAFGENDGSLESIRVSRALESAAEVARGFAAGARRSLAHLPESDAREALVRLAQETVAGLPN